MFEGQILLYEEKENSAVIWRCFSRDESAVIPAYLGELPVTELAPYCFSAHMDERQLAAEIRRRGLRLYPPLAACDGKNGQEFSPQPVRDGDKGEVLPQQILAQDRDKGEALPRLPALCGDALRELILPETLRRVGRYCFYNCGNLERLAFHGALTDWGSGVFTGCHRIRQIRLCVGSGEKTMLKEVLDEIREELTLEYVVGDSDVPSAYLVFPEFYEEGVENTPARILETHVHGSGILYRNCFRDRVFDFAQYDRLFPHARAQERFALTAELVRGRLRYPFRLSETAKAQYEAYAAEQSRAFADLFIEQKDLSGLRWLFETAGPSAQELLPYLTEQAGKRQLAEVVSYLMEQRPAKKRRRFEL